MRDRWWASNWIALLVIFACALPLLSPQIPPLLDLPGHMASYQVALYGGADSPLGRYYAFDWNLIGNLGFDLAIMPLGPVLGVETATKILAILVPVGTAAAFFLIVRAAALPRSPAIFAAAALAYNYPFLFGFVNYSLSVMIALLGFALWLRWPAETHAKSRFAVFAILAVVAWLAHAIGWLIFGTMVAAAELHRQLRAHPPVTGALRAVAICSALLAPVPLNFLSPRTSGFEMYGFLDPVSAFKWIATLFRDRWIALDLLSVAFVGALLAAAVFRRFGLRLAGRLGWPALALFVLFLALPQSINDSYFVAGRVAPYAVALALLAVTTDASSLRTRSVLAIACLGFLALRLTALTYSFVLYDRDHGKRLEALNHVPLGGTLVALGTVPCGEGFRNWYNERSYHLPSLAVVRRDAFVNSTWSIPGLQLLKVRYEAAGAFKSDPSQLVHLDACEGSWRPTLKEALRSIPYAAFDRLWLVDIPKSRWPEDARLEKLWSHQDSVLYRIRETRASGTNIPP